MENILGSCKRFFEYDYWFGVSNFSLKVEGKKQSQRSWQDTAAHVCAIGTWLLKSFRMAYITCFPSSCSKSERAKRKLQETRASWFPSEIPLSSRMGDRKFITTCFNRHSEVDSIVTAFFNRQRQHKPEGLTVEKFFENHVFTLPFEQTVRVPNPEPHQAFWHSQQDLETDLKILIGYLVEAQIERTDDELPKEEEGKKAKIAEVEKVVLGEFFRKKETQDEGLFAACAHHFATNPGEFLGALDAYFEKYFQEEA